MTRRLFILAILVLATVPAFAQSVDTAWVRRYNGPANANDKGIAIAVDDSGCVYVAGNSYSSQTLLDYLIIKYFPDGDTAWVRRYDAQASSDDATKAIAIDDSGNVYVTGWSFGVGTGSDCATIKYDPSGNELWVRRYNGSGNGEDFAASIATDGSGNVYVAGQSFGDETDQDFLTIKYSPEGDISWLRTYDGPASGLDRAHAIATDDSGCAYVTGESFSTETVMDCLTIRYLPDGDTAWIRRYNGPGNGADKGNAVAVDDGGNVYVTGIRYDALAEADYVTIKYDPSGDIAWVERYNGPGNGPDVSKAVAVDAHERIYVTGCSHITGG